MEEGSICRKCVSGSLKKCTHKPDWKPKKGQPYYFKYWFKCRQCLTIYMVEEAKIWLIAKPESSLNQQFKQRLEREP